MTEGNSNKTSNFSIYNKCKINENNLSQTLHPCSSAVLEIWVAKGANLPSEDGPGTLIYETTLILPPSLFLLQRPGLAPLAGQEPAAFGFKVEGSFLIRGQGLASGRLWV